ncbi:hypothetical protein OBBRIDRAFT_885582 [Obba rivulosa]|uniref:Uncharacterized protein n=1 Tax=Obba rivulosa TaxID=1052685 RepID=A0A8E2DPD7_9APHY|nr:hypothetical protein OBBRIDRAFT_885582 [Obba rivulosa]
MSDSDSPSTTPEPMNSQSSPSSSDAAEDSLKAYADASASTIVKTSGEPQDGPSASGGLITEPDVVPDIQPSDAASQYAPTDTLLNNPVFATRVPEFWRPKGRSSTGTGNANTIQPPPPPQS